MLDSGLDFVPQTIDPEEFEEYEWPDYDGVDLKDDGMLGGLFCSVLVLTTII